MTICNVMLLFWNRALEQFPLVVAACLYDHRGSTLVLLVILFGLFYCVFMFSIERTKYRIIINHQLFVTENINPFK